MEERIIYFSSVTENTKIFAEKLGFENERIPLKTKYASDFIVDYKYVLIVPTYGGGTPQGAVPKQVIKFLNVEQNRNNCIGVIAAGNTNFGEAYLLAGKVVSAKLQVPFLYGFELQGLPSDVRKVQEGLTKFFENYSENLVNNGGVLV